jgi:hypothetical protein
MRPLFEEVIDLEAGRAALRDRPYGVIEVANDRLARVLLRPFPKVISWPQIALGGRWFHRRRRGNRCWLYYNQPCRHRNFLALKYVVSTSGTTLRTFRLACRVLDEIARIKRSDAILTDVANGAISDRLLARWGWTPLRATAWHRLFVKRFYGDYPPSPLAQALEEPAAIGTEATALVAAGGHR